MTGVVSDRCGGWCEGTGVEGGVMGTGVERVVWWVTSVKGGVVGDRCKGWCGG